jgi:biopolymer transport protein ExbB
MEPATGITAGVAAGYGITAFLAQSDVVGRSALAVLLVMSLGAWYLIVAKSIHAFLARRRAARFLQKFWSTASLKEATAGLSSGRDADPFSALAVEAMQAMDHHILHAAKPPGEAESAHEFVARAMRGAIAEQGLRAESGMTLLASVGATAPFVGLFGTVWGVYNALVSIGMTGQGTLDKVAGPVGEALIMTALGLAVAIPAVLAYNAFARYNRLTHARLNAFANQLFALLTTGATIAKAGAKIAKAGAKLGAGSSR